MLESSTVEEPQIYKIYINHVEVLLKPSDKVTIQEILIPATLVLAYSGVRNNLLLYIDMVERTTVIKRMIIHYPDFEELKKDFKYHFREIKAGGGLVHNEKGEFLFIYRRGSWDLPKGKIESKETKKQATLREITEETGIKKMSIVERILITRHTYRSNVGRRIIKKSYWYLIEAPKQVLKPQATEDIAKARWMTLEKFFSIRRKVYPNILDVLETQNHLKVINKTLIKIK